MKCAEGSRAATIRNSISITLPNLVFIRKRKSDFVHILQEILQIPTFAIGQRNKHFDMNYRCLHAFEILYLFTCTLYAIPENLPTTPTK